MRTDRPSSGYSRTLALIHDEGFRGFAESAAPALLEWIRNGLVHQRLVVDLGCGSGIWASILAARGYGVFGIDASPGMIALARRNAPGATFRRASLYEATLPPCRAVTAIGEVLNYAFPGAKQNLPRLFRHAYAALEPGGQFIFDLLAPGHIGEDEPRRAWREGAGWLVCADTRERQARLERRIVGFRRDGARWIRFEELHAARLFEREAVKAELRGAGFRVRVFRGYGALRLGRGHFVYVARKPW